MLARPLWWSSPTAGLRDLQPLFAGAAAAGVGLGGWARAAMVGAVRALAGDPPAASTVVAAVALLAERCSVQSGEGDGEDHAAMRAAFALTATEVAGERGLSDPAELRDQAVSLVDEALGELQR